MTFVLQSEHGIGVSPPRYAGDEGPDDVAAEFLLEVQDVVPDSERPRDAPRVGKVVERAAAAGPAGLGRVVPELHGQADDLVPRLLQQERGDRGVHPARHGHGNTHRESLLQRTR